MFLWYQIEDDLVWGCFRAPSGLNHVSGVLKLKPAETGPPLTSLWRPSFSWPDLGGVTYRSTLKVWRCHGAAGGEQQEFKTEAAAARREVNKCSRLVCSWMLQFYTVFLRTPWVQENPETSRVLNIGNIFLSEVWACCHMFQQSSSNYQKQTIQFFKKNPSGTLISTTRGEGATGVLLKHTVNQTDSVKEA